MESKIRIINNAIKNANLCVVDGNIISLIESPKCNMRDWARLLRAMQELETIFAIPPVILTQYIHQQSLTLEELYTVINPYDITWDYLPLQTYIAVLDDLIVLSKGRPTTAYIQNSMRLELRLKVYKDLLSNHHKQLQ